MTFDIQVNENPILLKEVPWAELGRAECGACDMFYGVVRNHNHGKVVEAVAYDAFVPIAEKVLREIAEEGQKRFSSMGTVYIRHRTGKLNVGDLSVVIIVHTPHRDEAFQWCRYIIEELKQRVPIWKKEFYVDGETEWLKGHALCSHRHDVVSG